ncbi:hypothetical protein CJF32_00003054 [Rutstroemia sp. NJR-2017a WRK4]|nr:hypothetical protein CJF32_00003054 [Rutstroemia sp. NJR-2017a WRK4]
MEKGFERSSVGSVKVSERSRWPPLTRMLMSGEMSAEMPRELTMREKFDRWMVNEGYRRFFVFVFGMLHVMVFTFGFLNYQLKDSFGTARSTFSVTYAIARSAALTLHFDVAMILFPVCRTLISLARQTPLNGIIQFDKNITFHMLTAWSIVFFSWVHTIAHWNNFAQISAKNNLGIGGFLLANFVSGPGWTGYVMLVALMAMAITSYEKYRRANFERFWYTHHFFVIFFVFWSVHGAFCMIQPDVAPYCIGIGSSAIGVFWQYWIMVGDFTRAVGKALGCEFDKPKGEKGASSQVVGVNQNGPGADGVDPAIRRILPRVYVDGPFGSASEDVFKFEVAMLCGAGIGVTPFASILKSIWYRMNYPQKKTRLRKVYFFWICRDFGSFEWFRSLLLAIEAQDMDNHIEIHTYLTAKIKVDDATNIMINDANADRDAITGLRAPTNFGRPNWDMIFKSVRKIHTPSEAGVFFCGPKVLGSVLHIKCNMYSEPGFNFCWGKENF